MSGFVRRAQRKVAKLEAQLAAARAEVARQKELDVQRAAAKAVRVEERKAQKRAARAANPERIRLETMKILMDICIKQNLKCNASMVDQYMVWKQTIEFPPNTNLYQKCTRFVNEIFPEEAGIPIYAKTLTGELIPLVYHPHHDSRDLLLQLQIISPEEFPLGSTTIARLCEEEEAPVKEGDLFGLFHHGAEVVSYRPYSDDDVHLLPYEDTVCITYGLQINPEGLIRGPQLGLQRPLSLSLHYSPEKQTIATRWDQSHRPMSEFSTILQTLTLYDYSTYHSYSLTDQAQKEVMAVFEAIRRDRRF